MTNTFLMIAFLLNMSLILMYFPNTGHYCVVFISDFTEASPNILLPAILISIKLTINFKRKKKNVRQIQRNWHLWHKLYMWQLETSSCGHCPNQKATIPLTSQQIFKIRKTIQNQFMSHFNYFLIKTTTAVTTTRTETMTRRPTSTTRKTTTTQATTTTIESKTTIIKQLKCNNNNRNTNNNRIEIQQQ